MFILVFFEKLVDLKIYVSLRGILNLQDPLQILVGNPFYHLVRPHSKSLSFATKMKTSCLIDHVLLLQPVSKSPLTFHQSVLIMQG